MRNTWRILIVWVCAFLKTGPKLCQTLPHPAMGCQDALCIIPKSTFPYLMNDFYFLNSTVTVLV